MESSDDETQSGEEMTAHSGDADKIFPASPNSDVSVEREKSRMEASINGDSLGNIKNYHENVDQEECDEYGLKGTSTCFDNSIGSKTHGISDDRRTSKVIGGFFFLVICRGRWGLEGALPHESNL